MGINSTEVSYNFGQMGSATAYNTKIIPPKDHVIVAITMLGMAKLSELTPERLDAQGPSFPFVDAGNVDLVADPYGSNSSGVVTLALTDAGTATKTVELSGGANTKVKPGQFVMLVNAAAETDGVPVITYDAETPTPIYSGPNQQGVKVKSVNDDDITLEGHGVTASTFTGLTPSSQALVFIDEYHGTGNTVVNNLTFSANTTIFGRWASVTPGNNKWIIAYFGK